MPNDPSRYRKGSAYAVVCHPGYAGVYLGVQSFGLWQLGLWSLVVLGPGEGVKYGVYGAAAVSLAVICAARTRKEDEMLRKEFRWERDVWPAKTGYKHLPYVFQLLFSVSARFVSSRAGPHEGLRCRAGEGRS